MNRFFNGVVEETVESVYGEHGCPLCPIVGLFTAVVCVVVGFIVTLSSVQGKIEASWEMHGNYFFAIGVGCIVIMTLIIYFGQTRQRQSRNENNDNLSQITNLSTGSENEARHQIVESDETAPLPNSALARPNPTSALPNSAIESSHSTETENDEAPLLQAEAENAEVISGIVNPMAIDP